MTRAGIVMATLAVIGLTAWVSYHAGADRVRVQWAAETERRDAAMDVLRDALTEAEIDAARAAERLDAAAREAVKLQEERANAANDLPGADDVCLPAGAVRLLDN